MAQESDARSRVLDVAEDMFSAHGYKAVRLKDIAEALGMKTASLYFHAQGGKEDLFVKVMTRSLERHREGLRSAIGEVEGAQAELEAATRWLLAQPPMPIVRMVQSDLVGVSADSRDAINQAMYSCLMRPLAEILDRARTRGNLRSDAPDPDLVAGSFLAMLDALRLAAQADWGEPAVSAETMAVDMIRVLLFGLLTPDSSPSS